MFKRTKVTIAMLASLAIAAAVALAATNGDTLKNPVSIGQGSVADVSITMLNGTTPSAIIKNPSGTNTLQLIAGSKTALTAASNGITINGNTTSDSNLGTISSVTNGSYYVGSFTASFTGPCSLSLSGSYAKVGQIVCIQLSGGTCSTSASGSFTYTLPSALAATSASSPGNPVMITTGGSAGIGELQINSSTLAIYSTNGAGFPNTSTAGLPQGASMCWVSAS